MNMKLVLISAANCIHTARWANGLVTRGIDVHLISAHSSELVYDDRVKLYVLNNKAPLGYLSSVFEVKALINEIAPDLVNAHYATGYGLLSRLSGSKPSLLSVWGTDVYDFPKKSFFHRLLLKGNLKYASAVASTSHCMAEETAKTFRSDEVYITPFGVDEHAFFSSSKESSDIVLGTVKTLNKKYGIDTLIKAFSQAWEALNKPDNLYLEISGSGPDMNELITLTESLGIKGLVTFHGHVDHEKVPHMLNRLDVYCALSRLESFGVAILEACSCEKPVIVSDADGLAEVTLHGKTGLVVPKDDVSAAANAMIKLINDKELRKEMGTFGRKHVVENYTWDKSLDIMINAYEKVIEHNKQS